MKRRGQREHPPSFLARRDADAIASLHHRSRLNVTGRHIAIIAPPTPGHINPLQALGRALVALGHRVTLVHQADVAPLVDDACIGFAPLSAPISDGQALELYNAILAAPTGPTGLTRMVRATAAMSERLLTYAPAVLERIGAEALIADSAEAAGPLIAQMLRLPCAISVTGLPLLGEADVPPPYLGWQYRADAIGRFRNRGGYQVSARLLRPITRVLERQRMLRGLGSDPSASSLYVAQCPRGLDYPRKCLPPNFHYGGPWRAASSPAVDVPIDARPLVFCSLGTLQGSRRALFATMAEACAAIGARAVIAHGGGLRAEEVAALPGDPLVRAFWPQDAILRHCAAAVLHGGFNTVLDALAAGVPIVALPIAFEQPGTAARLAWAGAGVMLSPKRLSARRLSVQVQRVMTEPHFRLAALRLSDGMSTAGGAARAAGRISEALG